MSHPRTALLWSFGERYVGVLISIASTVILSRLLTPTEVGIYSMCAAFTAVAGILRDFGVSEYLIQEPALNEEKIRSSFAVAIVVAWSIAAGLLLSRDAIAAAYGEPGVAAVLAVLSLQFLLLPMSSPAFALMNRELAFKQVFWLQVASTAVHSAVSVGLAWAGFSYMSLAWGPVAGILTQTVVLSLMRPGQTFVMPRFAEARSVLRFGSMFVSSRVIDVLARNFHEPVIAKTFDFAAVGLFSRAFGLVDMFAVNVGAAVLRVATPAFAAESRAGRPVSDALARATAVFTCIAWPVYTTIALLAEPIIAIMFGPQWLAAAPIATALAISAAPSSLYALVPQMMSATGHVGRRLKVSLWVSPLHIVGVLIAAQFSLLAVAWVWLFSGLLTLLLYAREVQQVFAISPWALFRHCRASVVVALAVCGIQAMLLDLCRWLSAGPALSIAAVAAGGAVAWYVTARAIAHPALGEIGRIVGTLRQRVG